MNKEIKITKFITKIKIILIANKLRIFFDKEKLNNKIICFEFIEKDYTNVFYLAIKISNDKYNISKNIIIDLDEKNPFLNIDFELENEKKINKYILQGNIIKLEFENIFFNGDINSNNLLMNCYILEKNEKNYKKIYEKMESKGIYIDIQDYYWILFKYYYIKYI